MQMGISVVSEFHENVKKHLLPLREFQDIPIVSPAEFLRQLKAS